MGVFQARLGVSVNNCKGLLLYVCGIIVFVQLTAVLLTERRLSLQVLLFTAAVVVLLFVVSASNNFRVSVLIFSTFDPCD
jgi:hypothetical protein